MALSDDLVPNVRHNKVAAALDQLDSEDREAFLGALDSRDYTLTHLAAVLNKHTGARIKSGQLSDYRIKNRGRV